ncbi:MAG: RagB/SusD family nutrient uptake outer membrane protein [Saprospiraceae bacterium]|nr:RagB/SusD family nutrient uptake outer membrane protein [Saprospiraceae bacterium]MBK7738719.1 RagB/SusD family nutrient uptake outer membrane protein [Saprospiraceae bacterium]MBK7912709.1 RagB/SusD family nutrient uptake outer membrane protein [Saprospiraceae bacterium]
MKNFIIVGFICIVFASCDNQLDVKPSQEIDENAALNTAQDVKVTLIGAYNSLSNENVYGGGFQLISELVGDDREVVFGGSFYELSEMWRKELTTGNDLVSQTWIEAYKAINLANNVLSALDKLDAAERNQIEGEARFIRAVTYFGLVNVFAKTWNDGDNLLNPGVPLVTKPTRVISKDDFIARSSVAAVYDQILEDLLAAEQLLADQEAGANSGFALKTAATAFLARVYLMQGNYSACLEASNKIIESAKHNLSPSFDELFVDASVGQSNESIFKILVTAQDGISGLNTYFASADFQGRGDIRIQNKHFGLYESDDPRGKFFSEASMRFFTNKFNDSRGDVVIVRLAEMYLNRAECNFRLNSSIGAAPLDDLNAIRERAGATKLDVSQLDLNRILVDRKLELCFEGNLLLDSKRNHFKIDDLEYNDPRLVLPIPQREIDTNKALRQNEGY